MSKKVKIIIGGIIIAIAFFYGGYLFGKNKNGINERSMGNQNFRSGNFSGQGGMNRTRPTGANGGFVQGEVISIDDKSLTLKLRDGGSSIIFFSPKTSVTKSEDGKISDIIVGKVVSVMGTKNQDGSSSAASISLNQIFGTTTRMINN